MAGRISNDLQRVLDGRDPTAIDVLIQAEPGPAAQQSVADGLDSLGVDYIQVGVRNKTVFETTIPTDALDTVVGIDGVDTVDHSPTFSPTGGVMSSQPGRRASTLDTEARGGTLYDATLHLNVEAAWETIGSRGGGVNIGIVDTPIDPDHEAIEHAVAGTAGPSEPGAHGTWASGALVARDIETPRGRIRGVAPDADLYAHGALAGGGASVTEIMEGVSYCLDNDCDVINLSLGGSHSDIMHEVVREVLEAGAVPVTSAGNSGPSNATITCPAHHDEALAVGSSSFSGGAAAFSSRGPSEYGVSTKPDVMAYGGSAVVGDQNLRVTEGVLGPVPGDDYGYLVGTSMASPQIAGVTALEIAGGMTDHLG